MPEKRTVEKAHKAKRAGKAPTTQAGEFVREEIRKIRRGAQGSAHERWGAPFCRSTQGGSHQGTPQEIGRQDRLERACPRSHLRCHAYPA